LESTPILLKCCDCLAVNHSVPRVHETVEDISIGKIGFAVRQDIFVNVPGTQAMMDGRINIVDSRYQSFFAVCHNNLGLAYIERHTLISRFPVVLQNMDKAHR
jgi:hypothetical protein